MLRGFCFAVAFVLAAQQANAAGIEGTWSGTWTKAGDALPVVVTFAKSEGKIAGSFESDVLRVAGIPFNEVTTRGNKIHIVLRGDADAAVFDGKLAKGKIKGTVVEGNVQGTFALARTASLPALATRQVIFANGDVKLAGELILPATPGPHPAILFLHGSGAEGRWASRYLAQKFVRAGFVALIYDKRGVGNSTGDWMKSGFEELVDDAVAGIRVLEAQPEVDKTRIGIFGHSQGGTIAPWVAERAKTLAFVIASAASGIEPAVCELYSAANAFGFKSVPQSERNDLVRFVREIVAVAYEGEDRDRLDAMANEFKGRRWYFRPPPPEDPYWSFSRRIAGYRPSDHWRKVSARVLLTFGDQDERVPPRVSADAILAALKGAGNTSVTLKVFPNADHTLRIVPRVPPTGWAKSAPGYVETMVDWAQAQE